VESHLASVSWREFPNAAQDMHWALQTATRENPQAVFRVLLDVARTPVRNPDDAELLRGTRLVIDQLVAATEAHREGSPVSRAGARVPNGRSGIANGPAPVDGEISQLGARSGRNTAGETSTSRGTGGYDVLQIIEHHAGLLEWLGEHILIAVSGTKSLNLYLGRALCSIPSCAEREAKRFIWGV
jgi:hypothetical protein